MMKGNKRSHISDSAASPSLKIDPKKVDDKETPKKISSGENNNGMNTKNNFGTDSWCGSREKCKNNTTAATEAIVCKECNLNTHKECLVDGQCIWCEELLTLQKELLDTSIIPMDKTGDESFDSDATFRPNK
jgi:hypothetical protein